MTTLDHALAWASQGYPVAPIEGVHGLRFLHVLEGRACTHPGKHPISKLAPNGMLSTTTDEAVIRAWWAAAPHANLAVRCTDRLIVIDVDVRHGGELSLRRLEAEHGSLPPTWRVLTGGGGQHIFFAQPPGAPVKSSTGKLGTGIDIKADGGYVVVPPSRHVSGRCYTWAPGCRPVAVPLAPVPDWLLGRLTTKPRRGSVTSGSFGTARPPEEWRAIAAGPVAEGQRNAALASFAGHLLRHGIDPVAVLELLLAWNACACRPPLDTDEVERTVLSITEAELRRRG